MLKEVAGDMLRTTAEMIAHGVAPNDGSAKFRHREQSRIGVGRHVLPLRGLTAVPAAFGSVRHPLP
ncbi:MAG: hypothetical protein OJF51_002639 [Nitrospira sp.]|jgi:hypothetical protein|nr:MAG: hypothetical protein OJF51_002639 [Nitrospira sp.]